jgi:hypothetical protein
MALIGCPDKFITCSGKMFIRLNDTKDALNFVVENIKNTETKILIYSENRPSSIKVDNSLVESWNYDNLLNLVELNLEYEISGKKDILIQN